VTLIVFLRILFEFWMHTSCNVMQTSQPELSMDCGVQAARLILTSLGKGEQQESLSQRLTLTDEGVSMEQLRRAFEELGVEACGVAGCHRPLIDFGGSAAIIRLNPEGQVPHFVAVVDSDGVLAQVVDFPAAPAWVSWGHLEEDLGLDGPVLLIGRAAHDAKFEHGWPRRLCNVIWLTAGGFGFPAAVRWTVNRGQRNVA
jgi:ABC-type bacteriocin/lantibiotic exporter with double-glycine peptidase domain